MTHVRLFTLGLVAMSSLCHAGSLAPTKASQLVQLVVGTQPGCGVIRINADGTAANFVIPTGQVLVVNQIALSYSGGAFAPGKAVGTLIFDNNTGQQMTPGVVGTVDPFGNVEALTDVGNVAIRPGVAMCSSLPNPLAVLKVVGFLAKDR